MIGAGNISVNPVPLYMRVMGDSWARLAEPVRAMHATQPVVRARGRFRIEHGRPLMARILARMLRLPRPAAAAETRLTITAQGDRELWERTINGRSLNTWQYTSHDRELIERFGWLEFRFRLDATGERLRYVQRDAAFVIGTLRLRIPARWAPRVEAQEDAAGPRSINVDVRVALPAIGPLIAYAGIIEVEEART